MHVYKYILFYYPSYALSKLLITKGHFPPKIDQFSALETTFTKKHIFQHTEIINSHKPHLLE